MLYSLPLIGLRAATSCIVLLMHGDTLKCNRIQGLDLQEESMNNRIDTSRGLFEIAENRC